MVNQIIRSIKIKLDYVLKDIETEQMILSELQKCRDISGKSFRLILWNEKVSKKDLEKFLKRNSNLLVNLNTEITKNKLKFGWFTIGDKGMYHNSFRYNFVGSIMGGLNQYLEIIANIIRRENDR